MSSSGAPGSRSGFRWRRARVPGLVIVLSLAGPGLKGAGAQTPPTLNISESISPTGEVQSRFVLNYTAEDYADLKARVPDPTDIARLGVEADVDAVMTAASGAYDDSTRSVVVTMTQAGASKNRGQGRWEYSVELDDSTASLLRMEPDDRGRVTLEFRIAGAVSGQGKVSLPERAAEATWDPSRSIIGYTLPRPEPGGRPRLVLASYEVNRKLMGAVYKAYADRQRLKRQWTAKAVFRNQGTAPLESLRIRFRATGYSEWSPFERFVEVAPGQTVVATYYPQLDAKIAALQSPTAATVEVEWTWRDPGGQEVTDGDSRPVQILGGNQFILSRTVGLEGGGSREAARLLDNAELLTAWITPEDPVVREFAAWATKRAGGAAVGQTPDDSADLLLLRNIWDLWLENDFTYQSPGTFVQSSGLSRGGEAFKSFDETQVQTIKFPRDTIRDRSGTCLETAVLFASMAKAAGIREAGIVLLPDHAAPFFVGGSGREYVVESTLIGGGERGNAPAAPFDRALAAGMRLLTMVRQGKYPGGPGLMVSMSEGRSVGVFPPEMQAPPENALRSWGLRQGEDNGPVRSPGPTRIRPVPGTEAIPQADDSKEY